MEQIQISESSLAVESAGRATWAISWTKDNFILYKASLISGFLLKQLVIFTFINTEIGNGSNCHNKILKYGSTISCNTEEIVTRQLCYTVAKFLVNLFPAFPYKADHVPLGLVALQKEFGKPNFSILGDYWLIRQNIVLKKEKWYQEKTGQLIKKKNDKERENRNSVPCMMKGSNV